MRRPVFALIFVLIAAGCAAGPLPPEAQRFQTWVEELASPDMQGRGIGTAGLDRARDLIAEELGRLQLAPAFADGSHTQRVRLTQPQSLGGATIHNVAGMLPGAGELAHESVVVGAHYDHLGLAGQGGAYLGADDNASGVAAVLMLAERWVERMKHVRMSERRTIVFVFFSGEERGALGSGHFVSHDDELAFELRRTVAMVNFDMVGRMEGGRLVVMGAGTGDRWAEAVEEANRDAGLKLILSHAPSARTDHVSFLARRIAAVHLFTGMHEDYHRPTDAPWKINAAGGARAVGFADALLWQLVTGEPVRYVAE